MLRAIKIRLYPNKTQEEYIGSLLGSYRFVYNQCLDKKIKSYTNDKVNLGLKDLGFVSKLLNFLSSVVYF